MLLRDLSKFQSLPQPEGFIFFAQRFEEATFHYTLDSYRAPSVNFASLLSEANQQLKRIAASEPGVTHRTLDPILEEARSRASESPIIRRAFEPERHLGDLLESRDVARLSREIPVIKSELSQRMYIDEVMSFLLDLVPDNKKKDIELLTLELVSTLVNMGVSRRHLYESLVEFFFSGDTTNLNNNCLREFFSKIYPHYHGYDVCFKVNGYIAEFNRENLKSIGIELFKRLPLPFSRDSDIKKSMATSQHQGIVKISRINAYDAFSAVEKAEERINFLENLFRVFHHRRHFETDPIVAYQQLCCDKTPRSTRVDFWRIHSSTDMRPIQAAARLSKELRESKLISGPDSQRFMNITEFHAMSLSAASPQNQLTNLWTCLETISPTSTKNKIDTVIEAILPSSTLLYYRRLFGHLYLNLVRWNKKALNSAMKEIGSLHDRRSSLAKLILSEESEPVLEKLFSEMGSYELLRWRCFRIRQELSTPSGAVVKLDGHRKRVAWQLRRIYRARNSIVHHGTSPPWLEAVVETAHEYFDQAMEAYSEASRGSSGMTTIEHAFQYVTLECSCYSERLNKEGLGGDEYFDRLFWSSPIRKGRSDVIPTP